MGIALTTAPARDVRAAIAAALAGAHDTGEMIGTVVLRPHQREAVSRIEDAFREFGGALLADATGLGKTYVALAVARSPARTILVAPASLRAMWHAAMAAAGRSIPFVSLESLSRPGSMPRAILADPDLVIVDEAHHARNPATARYRSLARMTARAKVLLLSATPIHNHERDLTALLGLFLGARAASLDRATAMRCVIRRSDAPMNRSLPRVLAPRSLLMPDDEARMNAIVALPPPIPPIDGGTGGVLLVYSLLRRWASSEGALTESLRRRLARASAMLDSLNAGRYPSSGELAAWSYGDGAIQLAFPELTVSAAIETGPAADLCTAIRAHAAAVRALLDDLHRSGTTDARRAEHLRDLRARHRGEKIVAFTEYAETVSALFGLLRSDPGVAGLTAAGASVAGGALSRAETLARFAPHAQGARPMGSAHAIDLLLTTDLLSEGVNLQDASVVVHLDLPWTPARLEQRVGRAARMGSRHAEVTVYSFPPPASADRLVRVDERLRAKLGATARAVGVVGTILPGLSLGVRPLAAVSPSEWRTRLVEATSGWRTAGVAPHGPPIVAAVTARERGFIAVLATADGPRLVCLSGSEVTDDPAPVLRAVRAAGGPDAVFEPSAVELALDVVRRWQTGRIEHREMTLGGALHARARRSVVSRIAAIARRTPRHLRPAISVLAADARRTATARYGAGAEAVLGQLAAADMPDEAWLRAIGTFGAIHARDVESTHATESGIVALLLLLPPAAAD